MDEWRAGVHVLEGWSEKYWLTGDGLLLCWEQGRAEAKKGELKGGHVCGGWRRRKGEGDESSRQMSTM